MPPIGKPFRISTYPGAKLLHHSPTSTKNNAFPQFFLLHHTDNLYQFLSDMCSFLKLIREEDATFAITAVILQHDH